MNIFIVYISIMIGTIAFTGVYAPLAYCPAVQGSH